MNPDLILAAPLVIQAHVGAAFAALVIGAVILSAPKGSLPHRAMGAAFVALMITVALTAIFIRGNGHFSFIHVFVPLTLYAAVTGVLRIARGNRIGHRGAMRGLFFGALLIPGVLAFLPGRLMHVVVFGG